jgi:hypothetical protein
LSSRACRDFAEHAHEVAADDFHNVGFRISPAQQSVASLIPAQRGAIIFDRGHVHANLQLVSVLERCKDLTFARREYIKPGP